jgi:hypothetical protein
MFKNRRKYRRVKSDRTGYCKFVCVDVPKAWPRYVALDDVSGIKTGSVTLFKRYANHETTTWDLVLPTTKEAVYSYVTT